jgi:arginyl-tRNA synthetase
MNMLDLPIAKEISNAVTKAASELFGSLPVEISLEHPAEERYGDFSTNFPLAAFKLISTIEEFKEISNPRDLANTIKRKLEELDLLKDCCVRIEVAGPGFLNFYLRDDFLISKLTEVNTKYGFNERFAGKKVMVEFTDPNPFKLFHIGHLYSNTVGESLARLYEFSGAEVKRANYQGDVGMHVAKSLWGLQQKVVKENLSIEELSKRNISERVAYLGEAYALGAAAYKEDEKAKEEMKQINALVYQNALEIKSLYETGRQWSLDYFETIYKRLGTKFDYYFFESMVGSIGLALVKEHLEKGVFEKSNGAVVYKGENEGLHTRVFINSQGLPTYEAKDLGLAPYKFEKYPYDLSIIVTANEVDEYFKVILSVLAKIKPELAVKTRHISHGVVKLPEGKMSSRTGNVITGEWLLENVKDLVKKQMRKGRSTYTEEEFEQISEIVAVAAIKYTLLKNGIGKDIVFDFEKSLSLAGNSGPYIEYTYARCRSVLKGAEGQEKTLNDSALELTEEEKAILHWFYRFKEIVAFASETYSPNLVASFIYELSQRYNTFYNKHSILKANSDELRIFRLILTEKVSEILKQGLYLLVIATTEKM